MNDFETLADTTTEDVAGVIPEKWSKLVEIAAKPKRTFRKYIRTDMTLLNKPGDIVHIPRRGEVTSSDVSEGATLIPQVLNYSTALVLTPTEHGCSVAITQQALERGLVNLLQDSTEELSSALADEEDTDIAAAINTATSNILYGGDATGTADLQAGDVLTPELLTKAIREIRKNNFVPNVAFVAPEQQYSLGTNTQFTDAAKWGDQNVLKTGIVPSWMGLTIETSTNVPSGLGGISTAIAYHTILVCDSRKAGCIAVKRNPSIAREYKPLERVHNVVCTMDRAEGLLNDAAVTRIIVTDE